MLPLQAGQSANLSRCRDVRAPLDTLVKELSEIGGAVQSWCAHCQLEDAQERLNPSTDRISRNPDGCCAIPLIGVAAKWFCQQTLASDVSTVVCPVLRWKHKREAPDEGGSNSSSFDDHRGCARHNPWLGCTKRGMINGTAGVLSHGDDRRSFHALQGSRAKGNSHHSFPARSGTHTTTDSGEFQFPLLPPPKVEFPPTFHVTRWVIIDPCVHVRGRTFLSGFAPTAKNSATIVKNSSTMPQDERGELADAIHVCWWL